MPRTVGVGTPGYAGTKRSNRSRAPSASHAQLTLLVSASSATSGLGLSLTLVQQLVQMHGGSVHAHSAGPGMGSEFAVRLPVVAEAAEVSAVASDATPPRESGGRRILVVDDNRDAVESLAELLRMEGNEVETAFDGDAAIKAVSMFQPDIVLLDIGMPIVDGYTAARAIRRDSNGGGPFLVAMTGWGQSEDKRRAVDAGFDAHLVKPVSIDSLLKLFASFRPSH